MTTTFPTTLDERFRTLALESGLLDVSYDLVDSPIGPLFVAATDAGVCRIGFDPQPEAQEEELARRFGPRVLRAPRAVDPARRQLAEYFCTLCYAFFDFKGRVLTMSNSGLPYPIRCSNEGCGQIELPGMPRWSLNVGSRRSRSKG